MRAFRLADSALAALGAGRPSPGTLGLLRRAQLSRHLLLLREVRREARQTPMWYDRLSSVPAAESRARIADPMTGLWAARALATPRPATGAGPAPGDLPEPAGHLLSVTHAGRTLTVRLDDRGPLRHLLGLAPAAPLTPAETARWHQRLDEAWRILITRHPEAAEFVAGVLRVIVPARPDPLAEGVSATSAAAFGAVATSAPATGTAFAVALLHETHHSVLNAVHGLFELAGPGGKLEYSPWREDPRPAFGALHGAYAFLAVTRFWRTELRARESPPARKRPARGQAESGSTPAPEEHGGSEAESESAPAPGKPSGSEAEFEFARWRVAVHETAERLLGSGELTAAGTRLVAALRDEVGPWLTEPVDPEVERLAGLARADHHARWRLRNLTLGDGDVTALAGAWRAGHPPPSVTATVTDGEPVAESSPRLRLIRALLRGDVAEPGDPGDGACLRGDSGAALRSYANRLVKNRADDAAWSGLALVSQHPALRRTPEVVRAAALALPEADIADLAAWLSRAAER